MNKPFLISFLESKKFIPNIIFYFILTLFSIIWGFGQYHEFFFIRFFGLVPLIFIIIYRKHYIPESIIFGFFAYIINFYFLFITFRKGGKLSLPISIVLPCLLSLYYGLQYPLIAVITKKLYKINKLFIYLFPVIFVFIDSSFIKIFKHSIGDSQIGFFHFIQIIDITGITGVILILLFFNIGIFILINKFIYNERIKILNFLFVIPLLISVFYGVVRVNYLKKEIENAEFCTGALIQGGLKGDRFEKSFTNLNLRNYNKLTAQSMDPDKPDIIIWPESLFSRVFLDNERSIKQVVYSNYQPLIIGLVIYTDDKQLKNSALLIENRKMVQRYEKQHLLMFGEYIPFEKQLPFLRKVTPLVHSTTPGTTSSIFCIKNIKACISICYENIFPDLMRKKVNEGSNLCINITNDTWYLDKSLWFDNGRGPIHHSILARLRAIECRRSLLRCTPTGLSTASDFTGKVISKSSLDTEEIIKAKLPLYEKRTIYSYIGEIFTNICRIASVFLILFIIIHGIILNVRKRKNNINL